MYRQLLVKKLKLLIYLFFVLLFAPIKNLYPGDLKGSLVSSANEAVVAVQGVNGSFTSNENTSTMNQKNMIFIPRMIPIMIGSKVMFPNSEDIIYHNVYSESGSNGFDLGTYRAGKVKIVEFKEPGIVEVMCSIHTRMYAVIIVHDNPFFASIDDNGEFSIKNIPSGEYEIEVYILGDFEVQSKRYQVRIPEKGEVELNIR